jgi:uncharacterized protein
VQSLRFEWDEAKNLANRRKHGISFEEGAAVFRDPLYLTVQDRVDDGELRWLTFGMLKNMLLLVVAHTAKEEYDSRGKLTEVVRIISARRGYSQREKTV